MKAAVLLAAVLFSTAAIAQPTPPEELGTAQAAIINAMVAGATVHAPAELQRARAAMELARKGGDIESVRRLALQAANDARLAEARALEVKTASRTPSQGG